MPGSGGGATATAAAGGLQRVLPSCCTLHTSAEQQEVRCERHHDGAEATLAVALATGAEAPAIRAIAGNSAPLTFAAFQELLQESGSLAARSVEVEDVVGIVMANGPRLAVVLLACACQAVAAPLEPSLSEEELSAALRLLRATHVVAEEEETGCGAATPAVRRACDQAGCQLHLVGDVQAKAAHFGAAAGLFRWLAPATGASSSNSERRQPSPDSTALVLRTSGTTSRPKVVPLTQRGLCVGARCIGRGLALTPDDVCLNVMPLTHIGGISCSLLTTLLTGGSVICAPKFEPTQFLEWLELLRPTWYYAVPTIHKAVALVARSLGPQPLRHCLRLIRSGAANLPDADARELAELFGCTVLPTYSMTECMPVAQPPKEYRLEKPGTVGLPIASSLRIADASGAALPYDQVGEVCISGPVVTPGYLDAEVANADSFFVGPGDTCRWFRTGDVGFLDRDGFLFLTGRSKELIKRGGEQVSPYEVEEALIAHESVQVAVVFAVPNDFWGEEVAAALVLESDRRPSQELELELQRFAGSRLAEYKVPRQVVFVESADWLPKTKTGKYIRAGLAKHLAVVAKDTAAARGLQAAAVSAHRDGGLGQARRVKPHPAIYGLRYLFAAWVVFVHVGPDTPAWLGAWKAFSFSMPGFFVLAGFLLASSYDDSAILSCQKVCSFYRNRLIAAHPLYLLSVAFSMVQFFMVCPPNAPGVGQPELARQCGLLERFPDQPQHLPGGYWSQVVYVLVIVLFAQLAWPWGTVVMAGMGFSNVVLWFSSAYYFCLLCFPFLLRLIHSRAVLGRSGGTTAPLCGPRMIRYFFWPFLLFWAVVAACNLGLSKGTPEVATWVFKHLFDEQTAALLATSGAMFSGYSFPVEWALIFLLGMLTYKLLELNRRNPTTPRWRHWGKLTDIISVLLGLTLVLASVLGEVREALVYGVGQWWGGDFPTKLVTGPICIWIYGLGVGEGITAKMLSNRILVQYLSPAAYSVYLFHVPTYIYWVLFKAHFMPSLASSPFAGSSGPPAPLGVTMLDYLVTLVVTTLIAMLAAHKLNAPLTTWFLCFVDCLSVPFRRCCCRSRREDEEEPQGTLEKVAAAIKGLSGADIDASTPLSECGLDSFGTSALLGIIRPKFPGLTLSPLAMYKLGTVGALVERIDSEMAASRDPRAAPLATHPGGPDV